MSTNRRVPLLSNLNAVNSPYRASTTALTKQKRSYATIQREDAYGQPPPAKKQMLDSHEGLRTPLRNQNTHTSAEGRVVTKRSTSSQQSSFERGRIEIREKSAQQSFTKTDKKIEENLDALRQWQKHYRKIFPTFVFYFESVPEDVRVKCTKQVTSLGARFEKFFSNAVTHVVTTRSIPVEHITSPGATVASSTTNESNSLNSQPQTINPLLLDRSSESTNVQPESFGSRGKFTFDAQVGRRMAAQGHDAEVRRQHSRNADVLHRARELNMKIWALEKLQRMMTTIFDADTSCQVNHGHNTRSNSVQAALPRTPDLSQVLRNEKINGPSDRDPTVVTKEIALFKGPFIYIHDIDHKQRPIMVREYTKVVNKEEGDWPQFRSVTNGKCPFVEEVDYSRREAEKEKEALRLQRQQEKEKSMVKTRAAAAIEGTRMQPPRPIHNKQTLLDSGAGVNRIVTVSTKQTNPFAPSKSTFPSRSEQEYSSRSTQNVFVSRAGVGRLFAGEPVASGLQPSNVTSAIRSQMISSTAAQPGAKAGTSKELHGLQRKVLEKASCGPASHGLASSHRMTDLNAVVREDLNNRVSKHKEKLGLIEEDAGPSENEENARRAEAARKTKAVQQRKLEKHDPKPGYCENCQDKFDDFDEHILSRKHRKFAEKLDNWKELDDLLSKLARPVREVEEDDY